MSEAGNVNQNAGHEPLSDVHVLAINATKRVAVAEEGLGDIRCFLDFEGDEQDTPKDARWAVIEWRFGGWTTVPMDDYYAPTGGLN
jgi:hypothetical protein